MSENLHVIKMISLEESTKYKDSIGGMGGYFNNGMRWKDFINDIRNEEKKHYEALRKYVIKNKIKITGEQHQYSENGVPLFSDDTVGSFSFRAWGDFMAAIWSTEENKDYNYMDFYC